MKIGIVCPYNIYAGGGVQECVFAQRDELKKRGHNVTIITPLPAKKNRHETTPSDVVFVGKAAKVKSFHTTSQISASADPVEIETLLKAKKFDILHFHEPWVPLVSRQILARSNAVNIATFHAKLPESRVNTTIEKVITPYTKSILKYINAITAVSDAASDYISSLTDKAITIIPNGIDLNRYSLATQAEGFNKDSRKRIVFVGRLERRKGVKHLLRAAMHLQTQRTDIEFHVVGAGPDRDRLHQYVKENNLKNITFHGYVSEKEKVSLMKSADVFCSPALYGESFGIVLLEAMALGVPIVAGDNPGYASVMKERGTISLVDPKHTSLFAARMSLFLDDKELQQLWRSWALSYVKQFDYKKVINSYEDLYKSLLRSSK